MPSGTRRFTGSSLSEAEALGGYSSPYSSSASASTAEWAGAHSSSKASRSGEPGAVCRPWAWSSASWRRSSARRSWRGSIPGRAIPFSIGALAGTFLVTQLVRTRVSRGGLLRWHPTPAAKRWCRPPAGRPGRPPASPRARPWQQQLPGLTGRNGMVKQQPRMDKRRTASAGAASGKGRPQRCVNPVPPASHRQWRAGLRSPCAAAHAEDPCATTYWGFRGNLIPRQASARRVSGP